MLGVMLQVSATSFLGFPPCVNTCSDVIANAANEETRHKAINYFKSE